MRQIEGWRGMSAGGGHDLDQPIDLDEPAERAAANEALAETFRHRQAGAAARAGAALRSRCSRTVHVLMPLTMLPPMLGVNVFSRPRSSAGMVRTQPVTPPFIPH